MSLIKPLALSAMMGLAACGLGAASDDPSPDKVPDWSKYAKVASVVGEIVKADDKGLTLRITWYVPEVKRSGNGGNRGNRGRRPGLGGGLNYRNPFSSRSRSSGVRVTYKEEHHDYDLPFANETLIRYKHLPPRLDSNGGKMDYSLKERDALRLPYGVPGYRAGPADLVPGTIVQVDVIRDRSIKASDATERDFMVKYAIILGKDTRPAAAMIDDGKKKKK